MGRAGLSVGVRWSRSAPARRRGFTLHSAIRIEYFLGGGDGRSGRPYAYGPAQSVRIRWRYASAIMHIGFFHGISLKGSRFREIAVFLFRFA